MATGYEARQPTRNSFVLDDAAPVRTSTGSSGQSRGASVQGGQSQGGVVTAGLESNPGQIAAGFGAYFEKLMEPQIERAKMARFYQGYTRAQSGEALNELVDADNPISKIFGPTGFEEGAQFYTAQAAINTWATDRLSEVDTLKRMAPDELSKVMAETSNGMMTGDPYADAIIQKGLLEAQGPVIKQIAGERFKWQQEEAVGAISKSGATGAAALQQLAVAQARLKPEERDSAATKEQVQRFLGGMQKPAGMTDESYKGFLKNFMGNQMAEGNFYAVELMRQAGVDQVLDDEDRTKLENSYERYGNRFMEKVASDPDIVEKLMLLDAGIETERLKPSQVVDELRTINAMISSRTGIDMEYFDRSDMQSGAKRVVEVMVARQRRLEARAWEIEDREYARETAQVIAEEQAAREAAAAQLAWAGGGVNTAITAGQSESIFNSLAAQDWSNGNLDNIVRAYRQEGWHSSRLAETIQSGVTASLGDKYTKATQQAYGQWQKLFAKNPAAAATYYGKLNLPMQNFHSLVTSGKVAPEEAYRQAFANVGQYADQAVPRARVREVEAELPAIIDNEQSYWFNPFGRDNLNDTSKEALKNAVSNYVAITGTHSDRPTKEILSEAVEAMTNNGTLERYGSILWRNARPSKPIYRVLGLQQRKADTVVSGLIDSRLKQSRFTDGISGSVTVVRTGSDSRPSLTITGRKDGRPTFLNITYDELKAAADKDVSGSLSKAPRNKSVLPKPNSGGPKY